MTSALAAADPFTIALWTLVLCSLVFLVYLTLALGRLIRGIEDLRTHLGTVSHELCLTAQVARRVLLERSHEEDQSGDGEAPEPVQPQPPVWITRPAPSRSAQDAAAPARGEGEEPK